MQYFGTDGIRGNVEKFLTPSLVTKIGYATGEAFSKEGITKVCIGKDPRISSHFIMDLLSGTLIAKGIDVIDLGVVSTPIISYTILDNEDIEVGIMISASHNPYTDNGIKFFGKDGKKIAEKVELEIEEEIQKENIAINLHQIGTRIKDNKYVEHYINYLIAQSQDLQGLKIALDCANGSASKIAPIIFERLNAEVKVVGNEPNGYNINQDVGSTSTKNFQNFIKDGNFDFGFSYDGDADRVMLIDQDGELLDGDYIIYLLAKYFKGNKELINEAIVSTVMTNLGFKKAIKNINVQNYETSVGDKYVMRELDKQKLNLGGEQSGHIIISNLLPTGDGILTSVILAKIFKELPNYLQEIRNELIQYPQRLVNYKCDNKQRIMSDENLQTYITELSEEIGDNGRILVRPSGTEELIRIMVEHQKIEKCDKIIQSIIEKIKKI
ncbi:MAG: phosphoglucosamine mutase [Mycoplasmatales bacterium]